MIVFGFYGEGEPDLINLFECIILLCVIGYGTMVGFNPENKYASLRDKLPGRLFIVTPIIFGLCSLSIVALRSFQYNNRCHTCPTYVTSGEPDCVTNPYAPTSTIDWTDYESYTSDTLLEKTLANNPESNLPGDPILESLPQCWYIGCSECHPRYEWRVWLLAGSIFDFMYRMTFGIILICVAH